MKYLGIVAAEILMIALGSNFAHAADLDIFSQPSPESLYGSTFSEPNLPIEMGTGWYYRMDGNISRTLLPLMSATGVFTNGTTLSSTYAFGLGAGYKFNNLLRIDMTFEASNIQKSKSTTAKLNDGVTDIGCPAALIPVLNSNSIAIGYSWTPAIGTCSETKLTTARSMFLMNNAYVDLGTWWKVTPYVGAGVGVARLSTTTTDNFYSNDSGLLYEPKWTQGTAPNIWLNAAGTALNPQPTIPNTTTPVSTLVSPNWNKRYTTLQYNLAWAGMAGVAFDLTPNAKLDLGYRYLNYGDSKVRRYSQDVRIGFRYMVD